MIFKSAILILACCLYYSNAQSTSEVLNQILKKAGKDIKLANAGAKDAVKSATAYLENLLASVVSEFDSMNGVINEMKQKNSNLKHELEITKEEKNKCEGEKTCQSDTGFDAIGIAIGTMSGEVYAFRGDKVFVIPYSPRTLDTIPTPQPINAVFPKAPSHVDACLVTSSIFYLFRGTHFYQYDIKGREFALVYQGKVTQMIWTGLGDTVDAALDMPGLGSAFIQGNNYWDDTVDPLSGHVVRVSQRFPGLPNEGSTAAFVGPFGKEIFFFYDDGNYYRWNIGTKSVDVGYPKNINKMWLGC